VATARKLEIVCPVCGSREVFYTCNPACCFNHVCGECGATFETATVATGRKVGRVEPPVPLPEPGDPAAPCAKCESTAVYMTAENELVCANCGALLRLEINDVSPG
jgi:DNA-directed RNA polymerase subunit RPC12/RpoP